MSNTISSEAQKAMAAALMDARLKAGLTQLELSERLGKPQQFVSRMEKGDRRLDIVELVTVARALGIDPRKIFAIVAKKVPEGHKI